MEKAPKLTNNLKQEASKDWCNEQLVCQSVTAAVNHIGSTDADRLSRHTVPANHHCDTLQAGVKPQFWYTTALTGGRRCCRICGPGRVAHCGQLSTPSPSADARARAVQGDPQKVSHHRSVSQPIFLLPKITPRRWVVTSPSHQQQYFLQKCPFISVARPIKSESLVSMQRLSLINATVGRVFPVPVSRFRVLFGWGILSHHQTPQADSSSSSSFPRQSKIRVHVGTQA